MYYTEEEFIANLKPGIVFYTTHPDVGGGLVYHYMAVINSDVSTSAVLVLPVASSKVQKRVDYCVRNNLNIACLVVIQPSEAPTIFDRETVFDCNRVKTQSIEDTYRKYTTGGFIYSGVLSDAILERLQRAVRDSRQVEQWIKDLV